MHIIFIVINLKLTNSDILYVARYDRHTDFRNYKIYLNCNILNSVADRKTVINKNKYNLFKKNILYKQSKIRNKLILLNLSFKTDLMRNL